MTQDVSLIFFNFNIFYATTGSIIVSVRKTYERKTKPLH